MRINPNPDLRDQTDAVTLKRRRGRPPNPDPPLTLDEVRRLLAVEAASSKPNAKRTRLLLPLLASHNLEMKLALKKEREKAQNVVETDESAATEATAEIIRLKAEVEAQGRRIFTLLNHISELHKKNEQLRFDTGTLDKETQ